MVRFLCDRPIAQGVVWALLLGQAVTGCTGATSKATGSTGSAPADSGSTDSHTDTGSPTSDACESAWDEPEPDVHPTGCTFEETTSGLVNLYEADATGLVLRYTNSFAGRVFEETRRVDSPSKPTELWSWYSVNDPPRMSAWSRVEWSGDSPTTVSGYATTGDDGAGGCPIAEVTTYTCESNRLSALRSVDAQGNVDVAAVYTYDDAGRILSYSYDAYGYVHQDSTFVWTGDAVDWCLVDDTVKKEVAPHAAAACAPGCDHCGRQTFDADGRVLTDTYDGNEQEWTYDESGYPTRFAETAIVTDCAYGELRHGALLGDGDAVDPASASLREAVLCW